MEFFLCLITITILLILLKYYELYKSYSRSIEYINELNTLNKRLSIKVKRRTKQLEDSFQKQVESIHKAAIMGKVAQPMIHDISSPLSALKLAFTLIPAKDDYLIRAEQCVDQMIRIVEHGRELMMNKKVDTKFSPSELISNVILVLKDKFNKAEIKLELNIDEQISLTGQSQVFERILINVFLNALEELEVSGKEFKQIKIDLAKTKGYVYLEIEDNGRGIKPSLIHKIFEADFSSKGESNLGFGLSFVKESIAKYFKGDIQVESKETQYTKFILKFKSGL